MKKLIREDEIRVAAQKNLAIETGPDTVLTPSARDLARELGVELVSAGQRKLKTHSNAPQKWPFSTIAIASDHGGFYMKEELKSFLRSKDYKLFDLGPANANACDYPDYAFKVAEMVASGKADCGIMVDSVGIGSAMAANRVEGVLAAKCNNVTEAKSAREHNYANLLTLGSMIIGMTAAKEIVNAFLETKGGAERHQKRIDKILNYSK